jgi:hypothetical protein
MRVTTARPIRPLGLRTWFVMRTMYTITIRTRTVLITGHNIVPLPLPPLPRRAARPVRFEHGARRRRRQNETATKTSG